MTVNACGPSQDQIMKVAVLKDGVSNHEEALCPVLDLQVFVQENQFKHEFYEKPVACKFVIPHSSAHSRKMKMAVLVEEGLRRLKILPGGWIGMSFGWS